jgi:hypothetical protein
LNELRRILFVRQNRLEMSLACENSDQKWRQKMGFR